MRPIRGVLRWDYGVRYRHIVLGIAVFIGIVDLVVANWYGSVPFLLAFGAIVSPFAILACLATASIAEQKTIAAWAGLTWFGFTILLFGARVMVTPQYTLARFRSSHLLGLSLQTIAAVGLVVCILATASILVTALWRRHNGGEEQGGTPEEQVLSEEEFERFKPHPYETYDRSCYQPQSERRTPNFRRVSDRTTILDVGAT